MRKINLRFKYGIGALDFLLSQRGTNRAYFNKIAKYKLEVQQKFL
jgi:hypothetical protein